VGNIAVDITPLPSFRKAKVIVLNSDWLFDHVPTYSSGNLGLIKVSFARDELLEIDRPIMNTNVKK